MNFFEINFAGERSGRESQRLVKHTPVPTVSFRRFALRPKRFVSLSERPHFRRQTAQSSAETIQRPPALLFVDKTPVWQKGQRKFELLKKSVFYVANFKS